MPELPEVETCRRALEPLVLGLSIGLYEHGDRSLREQAGPAAMAELAGRHIDALRRRGKYLIFECGSEAFLVHLGMTGQLFVSDHSPPWQTHEHWRLSLSQGLLRYHDARRFGMLMRCRVDQLDHHTLHRHHVLDLSRGLVQLQRSASRVGDGHLAVE